MVLNASDYDPRRLVRGGVNPSNPVSTAQLLAGSLVALSVGIWLFNLADNKGSNVVNRLMGRLTGGYASTQDNPRVL